MLSQLFPCTSREKGLPAYVIRPPPLICLRAPLTRTRKVISGNRQKPAECRSKNREYGAFSRTLCKCLILSAHLDAFVQGTRPCTKTRCATSGLFEFKLRASRSLYPSPPPLSPSLYSTMFEDTRLFKRMKRSLIQLNPDLSLPWQPR